MAAAHRDAAYRRNLDWFRFWLQDYEDAAPEKREQYERWQGLRKLQCANGRSMRRRSRQAFAQRLTGNLTFSRRPAA
jgi:hypothetical protein